MSTNRFRLHLTTFSPSTTIHAASTPNGPSATPFPRLRFRRCFGAPGSVSSPSSPRCRFLPVASVPPSFGLFAGGGALIFFFLILRGLGCLGPRGFRFGSCWGFWSVGTSSSLACNVDSSILMHQILVFRRSAYNGRTCFRLFLFCFIAWWLKDQDATLYVYDGDCRNAP